MDAIDIELQLRGPLAEKVSAYAARSGRTAAEFMADAIEMILDDDLLEILEIEPARNCAVRGSALSSPSKTLPGATAGALPAVKDQQR